MQLPSLPLLVCILLNSFATFLLGQSGTFQFEIRDVESRELLPGKLVFLQDGKPVDLGVESTRLIASRTNTIYTGNGKGVVNIPAGEYEVWAGRGLEYSADVQSVEIKSGKRNRLKFSLKREVDTRGFIGADLHLHTLTYSGHGDAEVDERLISCLGEGLEWVVATDHNHSTNYMPTLRRLELIGQMRSTVGNGINTSIGHFNAFPLTPGTSSIDPEETDARKLFQAIRSSERREQVLQINHPRYPGMDYFNMLNLDPYLGTSENPDWSWDFDAMELLNETSGYGWNSVPKNPVPVKDDWYNFLHSGRKITAVGNSDSHTVVEILAGVPRNYIASTTDDPTQLREAELIKSIKQQQVSVNRGLYVELTANGAPIGSQIPTSKGQVIFHIRVQAPTWISCDTIQLVENGVVIQSFPAETTEDVVRFDQNLSVRPQRDSWYLVIAKGNRPMFPLVHDSPDPVTPLGFTNPIWVDTDEDGIFTDSRMHTGNLLKTWQDDPERLLTELRKEPVFIPFSIGLMEAYPVRGKVKLIGELFKEAPRSIQFLIYRVLSSSLRQRILMD